MIKNIKNVGKSIGSYLEDLSRSPASHAEDGVITAIFAGYVHVRLAGSPRKIISNVLIADHIRDELLFVGMFVKISNRYSRDGNGRGRYILTDIPPNQISRSTYHGKSAQDESTFTPFAPALTARANCETSEWEIRWAASTGASQYQIYWAVDDGGTDAELIIETPYREAVVTFDPAGEFIFFAVKAVAGFNSSDYSIWVTDPSYISGSEIITFGDEWNHGLLTPTSRWRVKLETIEVSVTDGASWADVTPPVVTAAQTCPDGPPDNWADTPFPTGAGIDYIQVIGDGTDIYVLAQWQNSSLQWRTWILHTSDNGATWDWSC